MLSPADRHAPAGAGVERRRFLIGLGAVGAAAVIGPALAPTSAFAVEPATNLPRWSNPATWPANRVPAAADAVVLPGSVLLDIDAQVAGVTIPAGASLVLDPARSVHLTSTANVVVHGSLVARPSSSAVAHRLTFLNVSESRFAGGGMAPIATDVGLWVMDNGRLDVLGTYRRPWTRAQGALTAGQQSITLVDDPTGWLPGDEIVIAPTGSPGLGDPSMSYDTRTVSSVSGRTVQLSAPLTHAHPAVNVGRGPIWTAEVLNLTRNVEIAGTAGGRSHVMIHATGVQSVNYARLRHLGPRQGSGAGKFVLGRYGLHFHHCMAGSAGSLVEGTVATECGSHAFVPHFSDGITFRQCISHDTVEDAYWWDGLAQTSDFSDPSHDITYDRCVASLVKAGNSEEQHRLAGFSLPAGERNVAVGCVAFGVRGGKNASAFKWPERAAAVWQFQDCVGHNNQQLGILVWQNSPLVHPIERFVGYHNGTSGVLNGAYVNNFRYISSTFYGNGEAAIEVHALSKDQGQQWIDVVADGAGLTKHAVVLPRHNVTSSMPVLFQDCTIKGGTLSAVGFVDDGRTRRDRDLGAPESLEFRNCTFEGQPFWVSSLIEPASVVSVTGAASSYELRRFDQSGVLLSDWNARQTVVANAPAPTPAPAPVPTPAPGGDVPPVICDIPTVPGTGGGRRKSVTQAVNRIVPVIEQVLGVRLPCP